MSRHTSKMVAYCRKVLRRHWPDVPLFEDIRELKGSDVGAVDVIYGGAFVSHVSPCLRRASDQHGRKQKKEERLPLPVVGVFESGRIEWLMGFSIGWTDFEHSVTP